MDSSEYVAEDLRKNANSLGDLFVMVPKTVKAVSMAAVALSFLAGATAGQTYENLKAPDNTKKSVGQQLLLADLMAMDTANAKRRLLASKARQDAASKGADAKELFMGRVV